MELINEGEMVYVAFDDWVNKTLSRFEIFIGCDSRNDVEEQSWPMVYGPGFSPEDALSYVLPWADFEVDGDAHREGQKDRWADECFGGYDKEDDIVFYTQTFEEWYTPPRGIAPCSENGEIASYRLILSLNEAGKAFLTMDDFFQSQQMLLAPVR